jgi:ethanolamine transporter EutH
MPVQAITGEGVREVLWNQRHLDLLGQIAVLLAGAFGVVVLFKGFETRVDKGIEIKETTGK